MKAEQLKSIKAPKGATAIRLTTADGKQAVVSIKDRDTLAGTEGTYEFGKLVKRGNFEFIAKAAAIAEASDKRVQKAVEKVLTKAIGHPPVKTPKAKKATATALVDDLLLNHQKLTADEMAQKVKDAFPAKSLKSCLVLVRSRPWHLKKRGLKPEYAKAEPSGKSAVIIALYQERKHTARHVAEVVVKQFGGSIDKALTLVRSLPWHLKKRGIKGEFAPAKAA